RVNVHTPNLDSSSLNAPHRARYVALFKCTGFTHRIYPLSGAAAGMMRGEKSPASPHDKRLRWCLLDNQLCRNQTAGRTGAWPPIRLRPLLTGSIIRQPLPPFSIREVSGVTGRWRDLDFVL